MKQENLPSWQTLTPPLLAWYQAHARQLPWRETNDPYRIWISEIMLQQTRVEAVRGYYARFMEALPDAAALAACPDDRLLKLWEGLGYYSRARNLKKAAIRIMEEHRGRLPADHAALLSLPGIGPYTAGAIASIAFGLPVPAVDGNVLRVRARVFGDCADIGDQKQKNMVTNELAAFMAEYFPDPAKKADRRFPASGQAPGAFNQALMDLGATVCLPNGAPQCSICPWQDQCLAYRDQLTDKLPVKQKKKPRRIEERTVLLIMDGDRVVLKKRPARGLLAGLYELPNINAVLSEDEALKQVHAMHLMPLFIRPLPRAKHIFTHIEWHMTGYLIRVDSLTSQSAGLLFAAREDVKQVYSIPSAFDAYLRYVDMAPSMTRDT